MVNPGIGIVVWIRPTVPEHHTDCVFASTKYIVVKLECTHAASRRIPINIFSYQTRGLPKRIGTIRARYFYSYVNLIDGLSVCQRHPNFERLPLQKHAGFDGIAKELDTLYRNFWLQKLCRLADIDI